MDVKTTFQNVDVDEEIYMEKLEGYVLLGNKQKTCKLSILVWVNTSTETMTSKF